MDESQMGRRRANSVGATHGDRSYLLRTHSEGAKQKDKSRKASFFCLLPRFTGWRKCGSNREFKELRSMEISQSS